MIPNNSDHYASEFGNLKFSLFDRKIRFPNIFSMILSIVLKEHQKYNKSKLKVLDFLNKNRTFNFDQLYF